MRHNQSLTDVVCGRWVSPRASLKGVTFGLLVSASCYAHAAFAQTADAIAARPPVVSDAQPIEQAPSSNVETQSITAEGKSDEIVVTARRRNERLQDVPIAITVLTPEALQSRRINSSAELAQALPGLVNVSNQTSGSFAIRGQGPSFGSAPGTYVYFAEVPMLTIPTNTEPSGIDSRPGTFFDMSNVEVLKGPQGTVFGRNATGGNILFVPQRPVNRVEGYAQAQLGNYPDRAIEGAINTPLIDGVLALRVAGAAEERNGYVRDVGPTFRGKDYENISYYTGRASLLFTPSPKFENYLIGRFYESRNNGAAYVEGAIDPTRADLNALFPNRVALFNAQQSRGPFAVSYDNNAYDKISYWQIINNASYHISDHLTIRNILSYSSTKESLGLDVDASTNPILNQTNAFRKTPRAKVFTGELQLAGDALSKHLDFTAGGYLDDGRIRHRTYDFAFYPFVPGNGVLGGAPLGVVGAPGFPLYLDLNGTTKSQALYGQGTFNFGYLSPKLEGLRFTAGYRYTWEKADAFQQLIISLGPIGSPGSFKNSYGSYNFTLNYQIDANTLLYASVRDAYKSGGVNVQLAAADPDRFYSPERLVSKEIGIKTRLRLDPVTVLIDLDGFTGSYENIQRSVIDPARAVAAFTTNVARARIRGIEANTTIRFGSRFSISENYAYTESGYTKITDPAALAVLTGANLPYVPKHKTVTSATFDILQGGRYGDLSVTGSYSYQSRLSLADTNTIGLLGRFNPGFGIFNAAVSWKQSNGGPLSARVFAANLTNKVYRTGVYDFSSQMGFASVRYGPPRTYGFQLRYGF